MTSLLVDNAGSVPKGNVISCRTLPQAFGAALGLGIVLPFLNFLRTQPIGDFFGEWACAVALTIATIAVTHRLPRYFQLNWTVVALPGALVLTILVQLAVGKYFYSADWIFWLGYLWVATQVLLLGQAISYSAVRAEVAARIAWALVLAGGATFALQLLQAARMDVEWRPYVVFLGDGHTCQLFGNVGQNNHANTLSWLGIVSAIYLMAARRVGARIGAMLLGVLLLSSALTVSRTAWLYLIVTVTLLSMKPLWTTLERRSRISISAALIFGLAAATWGAGIVRSNVDPACVSVVDRLATIGDGGYVVRLYLWKLALEVWQLAPWLGVGAGGFIGAVYGNDLGEGHQPLDAWVHNTPLQLLAEFGVIAFGVICAIVVFWIHRLWKSARSLDHNDGYFIGGLGLLSLHSILEFPLWYLHFLFLTSLFIGLLVRPNWVSPRIMLPARLTLYAFAIGTGISCAAAVVDYRNLDRLHWISELIQGVGPERVPDAQITLEEAAKDVEFFDHMRDYYLAMARPLSVDEVEESISIVDRSLARMPNVNLVHLRIVLATLAGDTHTARIHLRRLFRFHPQTAAAVTERLRARINAEPMVYGSLLPILGEEIAGRPPLRWGEDKLIAGDAPAR
jgi:O-antigen ligase